MKSNKEIEKLVWQKRMIMMSIFFNENRLHAILDRALKNMSSKQWLLLMIVNSVNDELDLSSIAKIMGCSRQNVKKLAISVEESGYIKLSPSNKDSRSVVVTITEKGKDICGDSENIELEVQNALFGGFNNEELALYSYFSNKMKDGLNNLEKYFSKNS